MTFINYLLCDHNSWKADKQIILTTMTSHLLPSMFLIIVITAKIAGILYVNPVSQVSVVIQDHGELPAFQHQKSSSDSHFHKSTSLCQDRISLFILGGELHQVYFGGLLFKHCYVTAKKPCFWLLSVSMCGVWLTGDCKLVLCVNVTIVYPALSVWHLG